MKKSFLLITISLIAFTTQAQNFWKQKNETHAMRISQRSIIPQAYRVFSLDVENIRNYLSNAPQEFSDAAKRNFITIAIPFPDGSFKNFAVYNSPLMEEALAAKYPTIKTYTGYGLDDKTSTIKISITPFGFHAMIISVTATIFIDPYSKNNTSDYITYYKHDYFRNAEPMQCGFDALKENETKRIEIEEQKLQNQFPTNRSIGTELRTYRLALAGNAEYTTFHGGTVAGALAAMVVSMNRINGIYESEIDVRMILVANNDTLIFLNSATDPYDNNDPGQMLGANKTTCNARIGTANYDIGHVYSTGGGGVAYLACVCGSDKAQGVTGTSSPVGDPFDVDYVAHEMGHQFGGNHTFNSITGACGGGNRSANTAYEPGSGVTIMGYAGICGSDDLAPNSIAYFHTKSFDEMVNFSQLSGGNSCAMITPTGNNPPVINQGLTYTIPFSTPFYLDGAATDPDGDTLTYSWEQFDLGPAGTWNAPTGNAPLFRSYAPSLTAKRYFPKLANVLLNVDTKGEKKPSYARTLHFRLTARDNKPAGAGVTYTDTTYAVNVVVTTAPFAITYPNVTGISWAVGSTQTITWNVGATDIAPINTPNVNIYLSTDTGKTYPITLAANVANNGAYTLVVPNNQVVNGARVWIEGATNIFFDINDKNFSITGFVGINDAYVLNNFEMYPNPAIENLTLNFGSPLVENCNIILTDAIGKIVMEENIFPGKSMHNISVNTISKGLYFVTVKSNTGSCIKKFIKN